MNKRISNINPIQLGKVLAVLYACLGLIVVPFMLLGVAFGIGSHQGSAVVGSVFLAVLFPVIYGVIGFVGGLIIGFIYNLAAGWTGGVEFTVTDVVPELPGSYQPGTLPP